MIEAKIYSPITDTLRWNEFPAASRISSILFQRSYMDYHADRFADCSLMLYKGQRLMAILPGCVSGDTFASHAGLTYGGLITSPRATIEDVVESFQAANQLLRDRGIKRVVYKPTPYIYHRIPADEDLYALTNVCHARLASRAISSAISCENRPRMFDIRRSGVRKASKQGITIRRTDDFAPFWQLLTDNLRARHNTAPVHTLDEISRLAAAMPGAIRLHVAELDGRCLAGTVIYLSDRVAHAQYISASPEGRDCGALDLLFAELIQKEYQSVPWFDFGISTEEAGTVLNHGLIYQKEGFGGRGVCYDCYTYTL